MREKNKAALVAGVLESTIKLHSKLIFKILLLLQMVQAKCQVIFPHFSAQQTRSHHCIKPGGSGHLHQQEPAPIHSPSTKGISATSTLLHPWKQHSTRARPGCWAGWGIAGKDGGCFLCVEGRGGLGKSLQVLWDHGNHWQQNK